MQKKNTVSGLYLDKAFFNKKKHSLCKGKYCATVQHRMWHIYSIVYPPSYISNRYIKRRKSIFFLYTLFLHFHCVREYIQILSSAKTTRDKAWNLEVCNKLKFILNELYLYVFFLSLYLNKVWMTRVYFERIYPSYGSVLCRIFWKQFYALYVDAHRLELLYLYLFSL